MELKIFELENKIFFTDDTVAVLEVLNRNYYRELISRFYRVFYGDSVEAPFSIIDNNFSILLKDDFVIVDNPFMLSYLTKAISTKLHKYINERLDVLDEGKELKIAIENFKCKFSEILVDLDLNIEYNDNISVMDFLKIFTPKIDFVDFEDVSKTYKKVINILSKLKLYKFLIFIDMRKYLSEEEIIDIYKYAKVQNVNLLVIENTSRKLLSYENKLIVDEELFELKAF